MPPPSPPARPALSRSHDKVLGGVVAGVAEHLGIDTTLARVLAALAAVCSFGTAVVAYLVAWIVMPAPDGA
jgi:phage shock protein C